MAGAIGAGSFFLYMNNEYAQESREYDDLQQDFLDQTDLEAIASAKALRDSQYEKVDKIAVSKDISFWSTLIIYGVNFAITWRFNGL